MPYEYAEVQKVIQILEQILEQNWSPAVTRGHTMAMVWPSAYSVALRLQRAPRALQGRVRVSRALHGREGRLTRLGPAPRALGGRAMSDDEQTQLETHAPVGGPASASSARWIRRRSKGSSCAPLTSSCGTRC